MPAIGISPGGTRPDLGNIKSPEVDPEKLKAVLKDPTAIMGDKYAALNSLESLLGSKIQNGTATDDDKLVHPLIGKLKNNTMESGEIDQLASLLGLEPAMLNHLKGYGRQSPSDPDGNRNKPDVV